MLIGAGDLYVMFAMLVMLIWAAVMALKPQGNTAPLHVLTLVFLALCASAYVLVETDFDRAEGDLTFRAISDGM